MPGTRKIHHLLIAGALILTACTESPRKFHDRAYVADTHNDVLLRVMRGEDIAVRTSSGHSDVPRLEEGGVDMQVFSVWVDPATYGSGSSFQRANEMIDSLVSLAERIPQRLEIARSYDDLERLEREGKLAAVIGVEGGHAIENSLEKLKVLHQRGMRYLTVTWNNSLDWASSAKDETKGDMGPFAGLNKFGREVIRSCNDLGVMVDVSHAGEQTFWDIIGSTTRPVIASHSSVYAICPHFRNLKDDQLQAIKDNGGVVFVNFFPGYLDSTFEGRYLQVEKAHQEELDSLAGIYSRDSEDFWYGRIQILRDDLSTVAPPVDLLIDHIDYIANLIGVDHVGLGSDFDGVSVLPRGMEDATRVPLITEKLLQRGYSRRDVRKILGENFKRVFRETVG
ncbi:MAG: dipeptidase [Fidelibacterota bacterium]